MEELREEADGERLITSPSFLEQRVAKALHEFHGENAPPLPCGYCENVALVALSAFFDALSEGPVREAMVEAGADGIDAYYKAPHDCRTCDNNGEVMNWDSGEWSPCPACPRYEGLLAAAVLTAALSAAHDYWSAA